MKAIIILNYASEEDIGKKTSIRLRNEENAWIEEVVIKPMPEKKEGKKKFSWNGCEYTEFTEFEYGWNACSEFLGD